MRFDTILIEREFPPFVDGMKLRFPVKSTESSTLADVHFLVGQNGTGKTRLLTLLMAALGNSEELKHRIDSNKPFVKVVGSRSDESVVFRPYGNHPGASWYQNPLTEDFYEWVLQHETGASRVKHRTQDFSINKNSLAGIAFRGASVVGDPDNLKAIAPIKTSDLMSLLTFHRTETDETLLAQLMVNIKVKAGMALSSPSASLAHRSVYIVTRLEETISQITERPFRFTIDDRPTVHPVADWGGTEMRIKQLPDGLRAIIGLFISFVAYVDINFPDSKTPLDESFVLILDEPELNLHPAWQRRLLPAVQRLMPNAQIIAATHSPFVISSVNSGWIHVLEANDEGKVTVRAPMPCSKGDTWLDAVEDALGLHEWYDPETEELLKDFRGLRTKAHETKSEQDIAEMKSKAEEIAGRSDSLSAIMAREIRQFERQLEQRKTSA